MATDRTAIRPLKAEDGPGLASALAASEPWRTLGYGEADLRPLFAAVLQRGDRDGYVLERDGRAAGVAILRRRFLFGDYLELLALLPEHRGAGLGRMLLEHVERLAFSRGPNLFVCATDFNEGARRFYERAGYQVVGALPELLVRGHAEILMRKTIGPATTKR